METLLFTWIINRILIFQVQVQRSSLSQPVICLTDLDVTTITSWITFSCEYSSLPCSSSPVSVFHCQNFSLCLQTTLHIQIISSFLLLRYVLTTLHDLVADDYILVYFHNSSKTANNMPTFNWLKRCYYMIDRKLRKNLKNLYLVHPTFWLKTLVIMTKPLLRSVTA